MEQTKRVIALGFFDGVHLGHAALLRRVAEVAQAQKAVPAAFTFDRHPEDVICQNSHVPLISSPLDRADLMRRLFGIQDVIVAQFDQRMMHQNWEDFLLELVNVQKAIHVVAGHDFHFGYKGEGNPQRLQEKCAQLGIGCDIIPRVELEGVTVSSTYIRSLIRQGDMERANQFLGHPYTLTASVAHGKKLGSTLGFPTVNLSFMPGVMPPALGVYATKVWLNETCCIAVTNVGERPTVDDSHQINVEGFLLDFSGDLYGKQLRMEFYHFLRGERKFSSLEALTQEVMRNAEQTRVYFAQMT